MGKSSNNTDIEEEEGYTKERLYKLIPAVYRQHDAKLGKPLEDLISIIAENVVALENDIGGLYDNWFIETCDEWVTSYIGDLVGAKSLSASRISSMSTTEVVSQRAYIANTIAYRRRKGTVLVLERLASDVTTWSAKAIEFFKLLGTTQNTNHIRLGNHRTPNLRDTSNLELLGTTFDTIAHTIEGRRIRSNRGLYNIQNIGIFLWRLQAFPSPNTHASPYYDAESPDTSATRMFRFNPLGYDVPLFNSPNDDPTISKIVEEHDLPVKIRRRALYDHPDKYYGKDLSIFLQVKYKGESDFIDVATREIEVCNLKNWRSFSTDKVAIDPESGRITLPNKATDLRVTYHYGFSAKIGGGFYKRSSLHSSAGKVTTISKNGNADHTSIEDAINAWVHGGYGDVVFEIQDSEVYDKVVQIEIPVKCRVTIRAAQEQRPILHSMIVQGEDGSNLTLDGLWFNNNNLSTPSVIEIKPGDLTSISIQHCTLVPGRDTSMNRGIAIDLKSYIRRYLCTWEEITTNLDQANTLKKFLRMNFANWITDTMQFSKKTTEDGQEVITIASDDGTYLLAISHYPTKLTVSAAQLDITHGREMQQNVYEFIVLTENGKKNLYVNGGNDNLQMSLNRTITGRVQILNSLIFSWDRIPAEEDDMNRLRAFLKASFYVPWLSDSTRFENNGSIITGRSESGDESVTITLQPKRAILELRGTDTEGNEEFYGQYELLVRERIVYMQSDAELRTIDSIIDGKGNYEAIKARSVILENSTVFGKTTVDKIKLASNVIFSDVVSSAVTQEGCVRFSYVPSNSKTPRRYMCQPEEGKKAEIKPSFTSEVYGDPGYAQLHRSIAGEIFQGGDNGAEMGVFNHLFQPQRINDLRTALDDYLRFGLEAGIFMVT